MRTLIPRISLAIGLSLVIGLPARAYDDIHLKTGIVLQGRVIAEDKKTISYERYGEVFSLKKELIALQDAPSPLLAGMLGIAVPGGGQLYMRDYQGAETVALSTVLAGLTGFGVARLTNLPDAPLALGFALVPWTLGTVQAIVGAWGEASPPRLKIRLDNSKSPRHGVGDLLAPPSEEDF